MATLEQRSPDTWRVYWRQGGRGGEKQSCTFHSEKTALRAKEIAEAHRHNISREEVYAAVLGIPAPGTTEPAKPELPTVREWAETWLRAKTRITPGTLRKYQAQLDNEILPRIGHLHLDEVDGVVVSNLLHELRNGRTDRTVTRYYSVVHALFEFAVVEGRIGSNPARRTDWIRDLVADDDMGDEDHVYLTAPEFELIHAAADARYRPLLRTLADSGARFGEATALDVRDVVVLGRQPGVWIRRAWKQGASGEWYRGATKGRNRRFVQLPRRTINELIPLVADRPGDALLFCAPGGGRVVHSNFRSRVWIPAVARAARCPLHPPVSPASPTRPDADPELLCGDYGGRRSDGQVCRAKVAPGMDRCRSHCAVPRNATSSCDCAIRLRKAPTPHDLRHSHAAWCVAAGRTVLVISRRLGHHSTSITERVYAGILPDVDDATVAALEGMFDAAIAGVTAKEHAVRSSRRTRHGRAAVRHTRIVRRA